VTAVEDVVRDAATAGDLTAITTATIDTTAATAVVATAASTVAVMVAGFLSSALRTASRWFGRQVTPDELSTRRLIPVTASLDLRC
jgi:hypothetical protein